MHALQGKVVIAIAAVVLCASFAAFANSLYGDFVFDDYTMLVANLYVRDIRFLPKIFTSGAFHFYKARTFTEDYYRPLQGVSYMADYALWKYKPFGYHLTNILIHAASAFILCLLVVLLFGNVMAALVVSLFYCVHPIQTCLVAFISGRAHLLGEFFLLCSLTLYVSFLRQKGKGNRRYLASLITYLLGLFAWEGVLLAPLLTMVVAMGIVGGTAKSRCRRGILDASWFFVIAMAYLVIRSRTIPSEKLFFLNLLSWRSFSDYLWLMQTYMSQLIMPFGVRSIFFSVSSVFRYAFFLTGFGVICWWLLEAVLRRNLMARLAGAWYLIGVLPAVVLTGTIQYFGKVLSEHYVNIAAIGFFLFIGSRLVGEGGSLRKARAVVILLVLLGYGSLSLVNNRHYRNEEAFYRYLFEVDPHNTLAHINLGNLHYKQGRYRAAEACAVRVIDREPAYAWHGYELLGYIAMRKGDFQAAEEHFLRALRLNPEAPTVMGSLGALLARKGEREKAFEIYERAIALDPESVGTLHDYAASLIDAGQLEEASRICGRILQLDSSDASAFVKIGIIEAQTGNLERGLRMFNKALALEPRSVEVLRNLGAFYGNAGNIDKAIGLWQQVLRIDPLDEGSRTHLKAAEALQRERTNSP